MIDISGEVDVTTSTAVRNGVPVIIQTRTVSFQGVEDGVTRRELHVIETEQPLLPLLEKHTREARERCDREVEKVAMFAARYGLRDRATLCVGGR